MSDSSKLLPGFAKHTVCLADTLDEDGYPSDKTCELISTWDFINDADNFLKQVQSVWAYDTFDVSTAPPKDAVPHLIPSIDEEDKSIWLRAATVGWSGNESILVAMEKNPYVNMWWFMSLQGGLVIYKFPRFIFSQYNKTDEPEEENS